MHEEKQVYLAQHPEHGFLSELPYNTGIMVVGNPTPSDRDRTIVITGTPRGGTTMVAECLRTLGLPIGVTGPATGSRFNLEDPDFQTLLGRESPGEIDLQSLRALVLRRNLENRVWGFKLPMALNSLPILEQELRGAQFVLIFRDPIAVSSREVVAVGIEAVEAMRRTLIWQERMIAFVESSGAGCLLLSYEKSLQFPHITAGMLANWCGIEASEERIGQAAATIEANRTSYLRAVREIRDQQDAEATDAGDREHEQPA
jgi:hypothetical protein